MTAGRYLLAIVAALAALAGAARAQPATYPPDAVAAFTKSCKALATVSGTVSNAKVATFCRCTLRYFEAHLTYPEFKAAGRAMVTLSGGTAKARAAFRGATKTCS
jgi:hypothetical protein